MATKGRKIAVPAEFRERMRTEHGDRLGFRMVTIGNFFAYEPRLTIAKSFGLLDDDLTVLAHLYDWGNSTANVISTMAGRPKNSVSRAVIRLTQGEFIQAETDGADRRRAILTITPAGRDLFERAIEPFLEQEKRMFGFLSKRETQQLDDLLLKILRNWSEEFVDE